MTRIVFFLIFLSFFQFGFSQSEAENSSSPFDYKWMNKKFPIDTLVSYDSDTLILSEGKKYYIINFWFTSCPPCIAEIKWLNKLKGEYQHSEFEFLAVSFESKESMSSFLVEHNFKLKQFYFQQQQINENFLTIGYPTTIILDKTGKVIFQKSGGHANQEDAVEIYQLISQEIAKLKLREP